MEEIDLPFMPSKWCARPGISSSEIISNHEYVTCKLSEENRKRMFHERISYKESSTNENEVSEEAFEWYPAKCEETTTPSPLKNTLIVFIHGGYWQALDLIHSAYMAHTVCEAWGANFAALGYATAPGATLVQMVKQIRKGMTKLISHAKVRGITRIFVMGHSAGAHLAATLLLPSLIDDEVDNNYITKSLHGLILISGVYDLLPLLPTSINIPLNLTKSEAIEMSITTHLDEFCLQIEKNKIRVLLLVGSNDPPVFQEATVNMFKKLKSCYKLLDGYDHFHMVEKLMDSEDELTKLVESFINSEK